MQKVLLAVGYRQLEEYIEKQLRKEFQFVEATVYREGIIRSVGQKNPDIVVIRETLQGTENILSIIYEIRQRFSKKRIVFIAGKREVGDALLASLVSLNVYDILYGEKVKAQDIIGLIRVPNEYKDVQHLQPKPVFDDRTNKVLFEAPDVHQKEVIKEVIKEVYVDNHKTEVPKTPPMQPKEVPQVTTSVQLKKEEVDESTKAETKVPKIEVSKEEKKKEEKPEKDKDAKATTESPKELKEKKGIFDVFGSSTQQSGLSGKQKILTFMGSKSGVGNTSVAFNTALSLAQRKNKVLFMELEDRTPSVAYWYELGGENIEHGIDKALHGLADKHYKSVEDSIIRSAELQKMDSPFKKNYKKFPETLDFMFFSNRYLTRQAVDNIHIEESVTRELYLHLLFQLEYDYIVLDVSSNIWNDTTLNALMYSHKVFITTTQDVSTVGNALYVLNELSKSGIHIDKKKHYIVNRFEKADINVKEIEEWVETTGVLTVPCANKDFINANYQGLPVLLSSKNSQLKQAFQRIEKTI